MRRGPMSMAPSQMGAFARSSPEQATPNLQFHVQPLSLDRFGEPLHSFGAITISVCNLRPTSRGGVHAASPDPTAPPTIQPNYLSTPEDERVAVESLRLVRRIVARPPLARFSPQESQPGPNVTGDAELLAAARRLSTTIFHPVGTAKMGLASDPHSVSGRAAAGVRRRRPPRRRRLGHAAHHLRQHQLADPDDRREGRADDPRRRSLTTGSGRRPG